MALLRPRRWIWLATLVAVRATAQTPTVVGDVAQPAPAPATKLESFKPAPGTLVTLGYNMLDSVYGIVADVREMRDAHGTTVRGLVLDIMENEDHDERAFIDADEVPGLLKGIDALLGLKSNPTVFENFEVQYTTRGALTLTAYNQSNGDIMFMVQAGRVARAQRYLELADMQSLRSMFVAAQSKLTATGN
jgi:hypothetical protein